MYREKKIAIIIPALNEEENIAEVINHIPNFVDIIVVADNGSCDRTAEIAKGNGAKVVFEPMIGYGSACIKAIEYLKEIKPDIVLFMAGDKSDESKYIKDLIDKIIEGHDLVIGIRRKELQEKNSMTFAQKFGNWLAVRLIYLFWSKSFSDLGPFRAIKWESLLSLNMSDKDYGWTVEMQIKAAKKNLRYTEVPVSYKRRVAGKPKIAGTIRGTFLASKKILWWIFSEAFTDLIIFLGLKIKISVNTIAKMRLAEKTKLIQ